jgi:hypothetical protein
MEDAACWESVDPFKEARQFAGPTGTLHPQGSDMLSISNLAPATRRLLATAAIAFALVGTLMVTSSITDSTQSNLAGTLNPIKPRTALTR